MDKEVRDATKKEPQAFGRRELVSAPCPVSGRCLGWQCLRGNDVRGPCDILYLRHLESTFARQLRTRLRRILRHIFRRLLGSL